MGTMGDYVINKFFEKKLNPDLSKGLEDIGASGYMNTSLQCLSNTQELKNYFLKKYSKSPVGELSNKFFELISNLWINNMDENTYNPQSFKQTLGQMNPLFAGDQENDPKDLINFLLERIHLELNIIKSNNFINQKQDQTNEELTLKLFINYFTQNYNSIISNLFYGLSETQYICQGCSTSKYSFQTYSILEFPLQEVNQYFYKLGQKPYKLANNKYPDIDLYECFEFNEKANVMTNSNQIYCNICKRSCNVVHSTHLYTAPNYLIINLNSGKNAIYECNVNFPEQLYLSKYLKNKKQNAAFELYAVISYLEGSFVAYIKSDKYNKFFLYHNSKVCECSTPYQYKEGMPYLLFYQVLQGKAKTYY